MTENILADVWGIEGTLHPLAGEYDLNFRVLARDGRRVVLKVMRPGCDRGFVEMLTSAHQHIRARDASVPVAEVIHTCDGGLFAEHEGRLVWMLTMLEGAEYARVRHHPLALLRDFGGAVARMHGALADFSHPGLHRPGFKWDLMQAEWIATCHPERSEGSAVGLSSIVARYREILPSLRAQPQAVLHNDLNDWNVLVSRDQLTGIIDFGDMISGPVVCDIAIAGAYIVLDHPHPERAFAAFVEGYHQVSPLSGAQLDLLWPLLLMRLAVSVTNSALMKRERPDDVYVVVSEKPAWDFLGRARTIGEKQMSARLRAACGLPLNTRVLEWLDSQRGSFARVIGLPSAPHVTFDMRLGDEGLDLSTIATGSLAIRTSLLPRDPMHMTEEEATTLGGGTPWVGSYLEPRAIYTAPAFRKGSDPIADRRTVHLGVDVFLPARTPVHAPCDGVVDTVEYREARLDYGGMVVLRHETPSGDPFWTLYGHLSRGELPHAGQRITKGTRFASLGDVHENGGWDPHLHFQLALLTDGMEGDWPGVADPDDLPLWKSICPNPAALLNLPDERVAYQPLDTQHLRDERRAHFATNLKLSYRNPLLFVRGWKHYLFDEYGRVHLDAYNNVPHVGHAHPRITAVAADQLARINTNTRYLHPAQIEFAEELLSRCPKHLTHVFFVNSGSEGNELALRLARTHTGGKDMITPEHGYHGNTTGAYDISHYKFGKPRGGGRPDWVQVVPVSDASAIDDAIARVKLRGGKLAGFIAETFPSVAGQIIPPAGYLPQVYEKIRAAGGVCIADEVQTGLGRLGRYFWAFEQQGASPDIVVLGKPLGNGHPLGAVITTTEIARSFDNGIEFFSTFGGSTLSCRVGTEVLRIVKEEGLQENARDVGNHLLSSLRQLQASHPLIADVRGIGLFIGVELDTDSASYVVNRLREERILIGTEGPADNVLKIRPPLTIGRADADWLVHVMDRVLSELT